MVFNEEVKIRLKENIVLLNSIEDNLKRHEDRHIDILKITGTPLANKGVDYLQSLLFRSRCLVEGIVLAINSNNALLSFLSIRAYFETLGGMTCFQRKLENYYNTVISFDKIIETLDKLNIGMKIQGRHSDFIDFPEPINVMTLIDEVDKLIKKEKIPMGRSFREIYDDLSEMCHPNGIGLLLASHISEDGTRKYNRSLQITDEDLIELLTNCSVFSSLFLTLYDKVFMLLHVNEDMPQLFRAVRSK